MVPKRMLITNSKRKEARVDSSADSGSWRDGDGDGVPVKPPAESRGNRY